MLFLAALSIFVENMYNMLSKNKQKYILSLQRKKIRQKEGLFIAEGRKTIEAILTTSMEVVEVFCLNDQASYLSTYTGQVTLINNVELKSISGYSNPDDGLAIIRIPKVVFNIEDIKRGITLFLDQVNDPGNMGTIIRLADWFGVKNILFNKGTVDPYQSKCIQSTMGAIGNVNFYEVENSLLVDINKTLNLPIIATKMDGDNIYKANLPNNAVVIMGNEANGISKEILELSTAFISIPAVDSSISESLNVAMACGIILSHFNK